MAHSDDKRCARLSIIAHLLGSIDDKASLRVKARLPERRKRGSNRVPAEFSMLVPKEY